MKVIAATPFNEYREEQIGIKLTDYFVEPDYFKQLGDNKPKMIYGSRGTGKTTLLKAMTLEQADDVQAYMDENDYLGFYFRTDLNVAGVFYGEEKPVDFWHRLYSYYFVCSIAHIVFQQVERVKRLIAVDERTICHEISGYFGLVDIDTFDQLISGIRNEERTIEVYLNNYPYVDPPMIGSYASLLREMPRLIIDNSSDKRIKTKHFIYLIDEFESLLEYQQKAILSLVKYADNYHTFIIGLRPLGLKVSSTIGDEYIRETDDYSTYILDEANANYKEFALKVCNKRIELFYEKNYQDVSVVPKINDLFDPEETIDEIEYLFKFDSVIQTHKERVRVFLDAFSVDDEKVFRYLVDNPERFYLIVLKLIKGHNKDQIVNSSLICREIEGFDCMDKKHADFVHNYRVALVFYLYRLYSKDKLYFGFDTIVKLSGNTLRYLLEMCNEIFLRVLREEDDFYKTPHLISIHLQAEEINEVSKHRLEQIRSIPDVGPRMRQFMKAFGRIASLHHQDSRLKKWEANHFSIKAADQSNEEIKEFLKECVFRGLLVQFEDNKIKVKNTISYDQYIYMMHPIYAPCFQVSFRKKQKLEFTPGEIAIMIGSDTNRINSLIKEYEDGILSSRIEDIISFLKEITTADKYRQSSMLDVIYKENGTNV